jgi:hypothetical protein
MSLSQRALLISCIGLAAASSALAGAVNVSYTNAVAFSDAGTTRADKDRNLTALADHLQALGQRYLPADQVLKVEVTDVNLAGTVHPTRRSAGNEIRVLKNGADWPRIALRYTLESNGKTLRSGEETVADMNYLHGFPGVRGSESLYYEKHMLDEWFKARFVEGRSGR